MSFDLDGVKARLEMLGCSVMNDLAIQFAIDKTANLIKLNCNVNKVPEGLAEVAIDIACGEYLTVLKSTGQAAGSIIDNLPKAIKGVTTGDTRVDFAVSDEANQEILFQKLVGYLLNNRQGFVHYRRLTW